jgi:hypothetical protein
MNSNRVIVFLCVFGAIAVFIYSGQVHQASVQPNANIGNAPAGTRVYNAPPPRVYTEDILMTTYRTNVAIPLGYRITVNSGYAPVHVVTAPGTVTTKVSPNVTDHGISESITYQFDDGHEVVPVTLHCTYVRLDQSY